MHAVAEGAQAPSPSPEDQKASKAQERQADAVAQAAAAKKADTLDPQQQADALDWFLADDTGEVTHAIRLNVGGPVDDEGSALREDKPPVWIDWVVRPLDLDTIKAIRKRSFSLAGGNRRARRGANAQGEFDDNLFNLGVVVESTVHPDLMEAAQRMGHADPRMAVKERFRNKSGLVGQIVGEVLALSGYDDNDVQDADAAVSAAGNSPE